MLWCRLGVSLSIVIVCGIFLGCADPALEKAKAEKGKSRVVLPGPDDPDAPKEFTTLESGLKYRIRRKSDGKKLTEDSQNASTMYRAWIVGDTGEMIFDSTYGSTGGPRVMDGHHMLPCIKEGLKLISEGGMIELEVPTSLCFKDRDWERPPTVPVDATVHFLIELIKVIEAPPDSHNEPSPPQLPAAMQAVSGPVDPDAPQEFTTTVSGLKYRVRRKATGKTPLRTSTVSVHYRGWLDIGTTFDSSYDRGQPSSFGVSDVIAGWTEGLLLTGEGGMIELEIPGILAYGSQGRPPKIPPNATLHFIVEIISVK